MKNSVVIVRLNKALRRDLLTIKARLLEVTPALTRIPASVLTRAAIVTLAALIRNPMTPTNGEHHE